MQAVLLLHVFSFFFSVLGISPTFLELFQVYGILGWMSSILANCLHYSCWAKQWQLSAFSLSFTFCFYSLFSVPSDVGAVCVITGVCPSDAGADVDAGTDADVDVDAGADANADADSDADVDAVADVGADAVCVITGVCTVTQNTSK